MRVAGADTPLVAAQRGADTLRVPMPPVPAQPGGGGGGEGVMLPVAVGDAVSDIVVDAVCEAVTDGVTEEDVDVVSVGVTVPEIVALWEGDCDGVPLIVAVGVTLVDAEGVDDGVTVGDTDGVTDRDADGEVVCVTDGVVEVLPDGVAVCDTEFDAVDVTDGDTDAVPVSVFDGVGVDVVVVEGVGEGHGEPPSMQLYSMTAYATDVFADVTFPRNPYPVTLLTTMPYVPGGRIDGNEKPGTHNALSAVILMAVPAAGHHLSGKGAVADTMPYPPSHTPATVGTGCVSGAPHMPVHEVRRLDTAVHSLALSMFAR